METTRFARGLAGGQGLFWLLSGVWPLFHRRSFEAVTGPKVDFWLVETVGALLALIGLVLLLACIRRRITPEIATLGAGAAVVLAAIDVIYVSRDRIRPVYLLDAGVELVIACLWFAWFLAQRRAQPDRDPAGPR